VVHRRYNCEVPKNSQDTTRASIAAGLVLAIVWMMLSVVPRVHALDDSDPTTTSTESTSLTSTSTSTTVASSTTEVESPRFVGVGFWLMQVSENQFQVRVLLSISQLPITFPAGSLSVSWTVTSGGSTVATGTLPMDGTTGLISPNPFPVTEVVNLWGLRASTDYLLTVTAGIPGNMVTGSRTITTNGAGWQTTTTVGGGDGGGSDPDPDTPATSVPADDEAPYMARIDENNIVIDTCVCTVSFVLSNPERYPGTWVPMWMGVNGKNYAGPGWTYDRAAKNFFPPTTTTTSTTTTTTVADSTSSTTSTSIGINAARANRATGTFVNSVTGRPQPSASLDVIRRGAQHTFMVSSSMPTTRVVLRAIRPGGRALSWAMMTNPRGEARMQAGRNLQGYIVSLWMAGKRWDTITIR
jgi:hypothetical protein